MHFHQNLREYDGSAHMHIKIVINACKSIFMHHDEGISHKCDDIYDDDHLPIVRS